MSDFYLFEEFTKLNEFICPSYDKAQSWLFDFLVSMFVTFISIQDILHSFLIYRFEISKNIWAQAKT